MSTRARSIHNIQSPFRKTVEKSSFVRNTVVRIDTSKLDSSYDRAHAQQELFLRECVGYSKKRRPASAPFQGLRRSGRWQSRPASASATATQTLCQKLEFEAVSRAKLAAECVVHAADAGDIIGESSQRDAVPLAHCARGDRAEKHDNQFENTALGDHSRGANKGSPSRREDFAAQALERAKLAAGSMADSADLGNFLSESSVDQAEKRDSQFSDAAVRDQTPTQGIGNDISSGAWTRSPCRCENEADRNESPTQRHARSDKEFPSPRLTWHSARSDFARSSVSVITEVSLESTTLSSSYLPAQVVRIEPAGRKATEPILRSPVEFVFPGVMPSVFKNSCGRSSSHRQDFVYPHGPRNTGSGLLSGSNDKTLFKELPPPRVEKIWRRSSVRSCSSKRMQERLIDPLQGSGPIARTLVAVGKSGVNKSRQKKAVRTCAPAFVIPQCFNEAGDPCHLAESEISNLYPSEISNLYTSTGTQSDLVLQDSIDNILAEDLVAAEDDFVR